MLERVEQGGLNLGILPNEFKNDRSLVMEAVKQNIYAFRDAFDDLRNDVEVNNVTQTL